MPSTAGYVGSVVQAMSIRYNNQVYEMKREGHDVIVLSLGEAFFDIPLHPFDGLPFPEIFHYSHSRGIPELRDKLASYYHSRYGVPVDPETEIIITAGSKVAIHMALMSVLEPGDEVLVLEPAWVSYPEQVKLCHGHPVMVPHHHPITDLDSLTSDRTRALILNNPHNPTGHVLSQNELEACHRLATDHDLFIISDEAYSDFLLDGDRFISCGFDDPRKDHTIVCNSMSKSYGMSGWRIGYSIASPEVTFEVLKVNQHLVTCPATILEYYLARHFDDVLEVTKPQIHDVVRVRQLVERRLHSLDVQTLPGTATFYLFVSIEPTQLDSDAFCTSLLKDHGVCVVPGVGYGHSCDRFVRVSVGTEPVERVMEGIERLHRLIRDTS
jgi:aspartate aminotransferase/aminotransferase